MRKRITTSQPKRVPCARTMAVIEITPGLNKQLARLTREHWRKGVKPDPAVVAEWVLRIALLHPACLSRAFNAWCEWRKAEGFDGMDGREVLDRQLTGF